MEHEMKNLKIAKSYLSNFAKPKLDPKDVCVPNEILEECEAKIKEYREGVKKFRHASAKSKAYHFLYGEDNKDESERKDTLQKIFDETGAWFWYVKETFKGCKGSEKIQKYVDEMQKDFNKLNRKGYIEQLSKDYLSNFPKDHKDKMFNKNKYALFNNPVQKIKENTYAEMISVNYRIFYGNLYALLTLFDQQFATQVDAAKAVKKDTTLVIKAAIDEAENALEEYQAMYTYIGPELDKYLNDIEDNKALKPKPKEILSIYNQNVEELSKYISKMKNIDMVTFFKRYFDDDYIVANTEVISFFNQYLVKFHKTATSNNYAFNDLKTYDKQLIRAYKELQPTLAELTSTPGRTPASSAISKSKSNAITREITQYKEKVDAAKKEFDNTIEKFHQMKNDFYAKCEAYKSSKEEQEKIFKVHLAFAILGIALPILSALSPLAEIAIAGGAPAPVGPVPQG